MQDNKSKSVIEFDSVSSIKSVTIQTSPNVKITTRFMKGKTLMFAKTSVISFVYDMNDVFCFSEDNPEMHAIYDKPVHLYSLSLICNLNCQLNEKDSRNLIFEVMIDSKIFERLDLSNEFWSQITNK